MSEMVERVARALAVKLQPRWCTASFFDAQANRLAAIRETEEDVVLMPDELRALARAAIEAMRQPTPDMLLAFTNATVNDWATGSGQMRGFSAMVDAALEPWA